MNLKLASIMTASLVGVLVCFYIDHRNRARINRENFGYLLNTTTGELTKPNELLDLAKVMRLQDDYINSTSAVDRLNDLEFQMNLAHPLELDQSYSDASDLALSGWPVADPAACGRHLGWIRDRLQENSNYALAKGRLALELTNLMDTFGKPQAALFSGLTSWTGSYERCLKTSLNHNQIRTRYCWARLKFKSWPREQPVRPQPRIRAGVCLPETCDTASFHEQRHQIEWLLKLELSEFYRENLELDSMFCLPDERSPIRRIGTGGRIYLGLLVCWIALVLLATVIYEVRRRRQREELSESLAQKQPPPLTTVIRKYSLENATTSFGARIIEAFSMRNSFKEFMRSNQMDKSARVDLRCLDMIKTLMTIMIVIGHGLYMTIRMSRTNMAAIELATTGTALTIMSAGRFVDSFFLIFGLLATYMLLRKFPVDQLVRPATWLTYNLAVMVRLMPVFMPLLWYSRLISVKTGAGPWWDYGVYRWSLKGHCVREPAWKIIPQVSYLGHMPGLACMPTAWFLIVYTQLCLVLPLFVYVISKIRSGFGRTLIVLIVCLVSSLAIILRTVSQSTFDLDSLASYGATMMDLMDKFESSGYLSSVARAGNVALGCLAGHLLHSYELADSYKWPRLFRSRICLSLIIATNVLVYMMPYISDLLRSQTNHKTSLLEFNLGTTILSLAWSISNAALIILATTSYRRTAIVRFAGHAFWHTINKLGLAVYLVHWEILWGAVTGYEQAPSVGFMMDFWKLSAFGLVVAFPAAFAIYILFEAPVISMMGAYQRRSVTRKATLELKPDKVETKPTSLVAD